MRVLLTGASGFIGTHCLRLLMAQDCEIHAVSRGGQATSGSRVRWHAADLRDPAQAADLIGSVRPTHLLHAAWVATPRVYAQSPENADWLRAGQAMAEAFGRTGGIRFVGVGSSAEYAAGERLCSEDVTPVRPVWPYGKCKAECWLAIEAAARQHGYAAAWGRLFLPYGPGDPPQRLIPSVLTAFRDGKPLPATHGGQVRDFVHAPDAADLMVRLLLSSETGAFNVGTGRGSTVRSVIEYLADRYGGRDLVRFGAIDTASGEPPVLVADMTKAKARLGWSAATGLEAGLDGALADWKAAH